MRSTGLVLACEIRLRESVGVIRNTLDSGVHSRAVQLSGSGEENSELRAALLSIWIHGPETLELNNVASTVHLNEILSYANSTLDIAAFKDASMNGLQIEGAEQIGLLAVSVDAGLSIVEEAAAMGANALLVHHGIFWGSCSPVSGARKKLIKTLLDKDISLLAYHLPLDAHLSLGNNAALADLLELSNQQAAAPYQGVPIGCSGDNKDLTFEEMLARLKKLEGSPGDIVSLPFGPSKPRRVCLVSGSGADQLYRYKEEGFDTLITGEAKQFAYHFCKENGLNAIFAGHYATETLGVKRLAEDLEGRFGLPWKFINEPTGI